MKRVLPVLILFLTGSLLFAESVKFEFKQKKGDSGSYISTVEEDVYVNGSLSHHAQIINRISSNIMNTADDGEAFIYATYMTTEDTLRAVSGRHLSWGEESASVFARKKTGELTISDDIYMPTVRNVPVFPDKKVKPGDTWQADGKEVQDVRKAFNMDKALIFPFTATYTYAGKAEGEKNIDIIDVVYEFSFTNSIEKLKGGETLTSSKGYSKQKLFWDNKKGLLDHYEEEFQINISDVYNNLYVFQGYAKAELTEYKSVNNEETVQELQEQVVKLQLKDISVRKGEKGLTISLENIQFEPDSSVLMESEKVKLQKLSEILKQFTNDLLITGHCAERGTERNRQIISEERAEAVASYLQELGVRDSLHIFTQGKGSKEPIASNMTEEGRSKNRRVEITVMD